MSLLEIPRKGNPSIWVESRYPEPVLMGKSDFITLVGQT